MKSLIGLKSSCFIAMYLWLFVCCCMRSLCDVLVMASKLFVHCHLAMKYVQLAI